MFGERLRSVRIKNNLSQEQLGEKINVSRQAISKWETGEGYPEIDKLLYISDLFGISLDYLIKGKKSNCHSVDNINSDINTEKIKNFLCRAKKETYAGEAKESKSSRPSSHDLEYGEGNFKYIDTYLGSKNFIGEEAIWINEKPFWAMNYRGRVLCDKFSGSFLKEVLSSVKEDMPYRGPKIYIKGEFTYQCMIDGDFDWFIGKEEIYLNNEKIYECNFHGGITI
ncbi:MAG: DUF5680 domain-containing protein [Sarcina sp.]